MLCGMPALNTNFFFEQKTDEKMHLTKQNIFLKKTNLFVLYTEPQQKKRIKYTQSR